MVALPAATVVLLRDRDAGMEALMLQKGSAVAFAGMWVFPGGRIDAADADPTLPGGDLGAARRAAAREAREEAGLAVDPDDLEPFSHWVPPLDAARRFSTWFFLARATDASVVRVDGGEIHEHGWFRPAVALARRDSGAIELAPPTWVTLWRLSTAGNVESALALARTSGPERFSARIVPTAGGSVALTSGDAGFEDGDVERPGPRRRLWMLQAGWRLEETAAAR